MKCKCVGSWQNLGRLNGRTQHDLVGSRRRRKRETESTISRRSLSPFSFRLAVILVPRAIGRTRGRIPGRTHGRIPGGRHISRRIMELFLEAIIRPVEPRSPAEILPLNPVPPAIGCVDLIRIIGAGVDKGGDWEPVSEVVRFSDVLGSSIYSLLIHESISRDLRLVPEGLESVNPSLYVSRHEFGVLPPFS